MPELPAIFFGHGNPMNAIGQNQFTEAWTRIGQQTPRPRAILSISAHWYIQQTGVTITTSPRTIHDFGGFPQELYQVRYPAPGDPQLARRVQKLLAPLPVHLDESWGLDHGTWSVLVHVYPAADIPVVQLSLDASQPSEFHFRIGERLAPLRDEGILIIGSGNLVHNLRAVDWSFTVQGPYDWAARFEDQARQMIMGHEIAPLLDYSKLGRDAMLAIPTPDHYLPLLYVLGTQQKADPVSFPVEGADGGSISMLAVRIG
jgi:4,5-DOPA dioxygenase extradiol